MSKAINGEGSIRQRKSGRMAGKWRVQWGYDDPTSGEFTVVDKTFKTQTEAKEFLRDLKARVHTGQVIEDANQKKALTLNAWFDELAGAKEIKDKKTRKVIQEKVAGRWEQDGMLAQTISVKVSRYNTHVRNSMLGDMPIKLISADHVRSYYRKLRSAGKSIATINDVKGVLVKAANDAIDTYERLPNLRNVFSKVKVEPAPRRQAIAITVKQAKKAIARQDTARERAMLGLLLLGGVRLSEMMALAKDQIDFKKGIIVIDRAVKFGATGRQTIGLPKGGTKLDPRTRLVVMCPSLANLLCELMDEPGRYLFPAASGDQPRMKKLVYGTWKKMRQKAKYLPAGIAMKDCRLSHNNWIEKLMPTVSTSTRLEHMGHSTRQRNSENKGLTVNLTNYTRFLSEAHDLLRTRLEEVMGLAGRPMRQFSGNTRIL